MSRFVPVGVLRFVLGFFLLVLGVTDLIPGLEEGVFSMRSDLVQLESVFGVLELLSGALLVAGFIGFVRRNTRSWGNFAVLLFWLVRVVLTRFVWGLSVSNSAIIFSPSFSGWLVLLSCELIIAAALFTVYRVYD